MCDCPEYSESSRLSWVFEAHFLDYCFTFLKSLLTVSVRRFNRFARYCCKCTLGSVFFTFIIACTFRLPALSGTLGCTIAVAAYGVVPFTGVETVNF